MTGQCPASNDGQHRAMRLDAECTPSMEVCRTCFLVEYTNGSSRLVDVNELRSLLCGAVTITEIERV